MVTARRSTWCESQPMKMAAAEALWNTEEPASFSLLTIGDLIAAQGGIRHPHPAHVVPDGLQPDSIAKSKASTICRQNLTRRMAQAITSRRWRWFLLVFPHHGGRRLCHDRPWRLYALFLTDPWVKYLTRDALDPESLSLGDCTAVPGEHFRLAVDRTGPLSLGGLWPDEDRRWRFASCRLRWQVLDHADRLHV